MVCFGALFKILMTGTQASVQNQDVCTELIRAVGGDDISGNHTQISRLYKCEANVPDTAVDGAKSVVFEDVVAQLKKDLLTRYIAEARLPLIILALKDVLSRDTMSNDTHLAKYRKSELIGMIDVDAAEFLACFLIYVCANVKNRDGKDGKTDYITKDYVNSFDTQKHTINLVDVPVIKTQQLQCTLNRDDAHKIMAQEMVALLQEMYPEDERISYYLSDVLSNIGNYRGLSLTKNKQVADQWSFMDRLCEQYAMDKMRIPADSEKQFFRSQAKVYEHLSDQYFSYSGPTSMGKSFIMRMFIKQQILENKKENYAIIVPTKALINEVSNKIIKDDLREMLEQYNYRVVTAGGDIALKQGHNFIFVMTPERFLYYLIDNPTQSVEYLFVDEAHKISSKDDRSSFYYKIVEMLSGRRRKTHIIFASPNIPNPEVYLQLISDEECATSQGLASTYSPVSQMKYIVNYETQEIRMFNSQKNESIFIRNLESNENLPYLLNTVGKDAQNIVFCSSVGQAVAKAREYADTLLYSQNDDLDKISKEIQQEVHAEYYLAGIIRKGVAYHIGYLPTTIRLRIEELFRQGLIKTLFCTSTLVEGVNLPADNLFVTNYKIGRTKMGSVDFKNLVGRVGRIEFNL